MPFLRSLLLALLVAVCFVPEVGRASCNVIPGISADFRGALGVVSRPFASPGDEVGIVVQKGLCDGASLGLGFDPSDLAVTVLFQPPGGPSHAVVTTPDCSVVAGALSDCAGALAPGGVPVRVDCVESALRFANDEFGRRQLFFPFPDATDYAFPAGPTAPLAGPARLLVTRVGDPLRCDLQSAPATRCREVRDDPGAGLVACVDELYTLDGTCRVGDAQVDPELGHFVALPAPNDYAGLCDDGVSPGAGCTPGEDGVLGFTLDAAGNAYIPWNFEAVLMRFPEGPDGLPVARLGHVRVRLDSGVGDGSTPALETASVLTSLSPEGLPVPAFFTPLAGGNVAGDGLDTVLFGAIDAPRIVTRVARRVCVDGGGEVSGSCDGDEDCSGSAACSEPLFDFTGQLAQAVGAIEIDAADYDVEADLPVPLDGVEESAGVLSVVVNEAILGQSLNSDADTDDFVVTLRSRATGTAEDIDGTQGRAVARVPFRAPFRDAPGDEPRLFSQPAVAVDGDLLAYLESEAREGGLGAAGLNGDGDLIDSVLRVFQLGTPVDLAAGVGSVVPLPLIDDRPLAISDGLLFFVGAEVFDTSGETQVVSVTILGDPAGGASIRPSLSGDGSTVVYESMAEDIDGPPNLASDVFAYDVQGETNEIVSVDSDENPGSPFLVPISYTLPGQDPLVDMAPLLFNGLASVSGDGSLATFRSSADDLTDSDGNAGDDVFVRDLVAGTTQRASLRDDETSPTPMVCTALDLDVTVGAATAHVDADYPLGAVDAMISRNGQFVVFSSYHTDLVPGDENDACGPPLTSPLAFGTIGEAQLGVRSSYYAQILPLFERSRGMDVFVRDLVNETTDRVSVDSDEMEGTWNSGVSFQLAPAQVRGPRISDDGQYVVFDSLSQLADEDLEGPFGNCTVELPPLPPLPVPCVDVYLRDRVNGTTTLVSRSDLGPVDGPSVVDGITPDGRFVVFSSAASGLVPGDTNGVADLFLYEVATGRLTRESVSGIGEQANGNSGAGMLSRDATIIGFGSEATNLVDDDIEGFAEFFFRNRIGAIGRAVSSYPTPLEGGSSVAASDFLSSIVSSARCADPSDPACSEPPGCALSDPEDPTECNFVLLSRANTEGDANGDGDVADVYLRVVSQSPAADVHLPAAAWVTVAGGKAAFLRPERDRGGAPDLAQGGTDCLGPAPGCPHEDLNGDADIEDLVVQFYAGRPGPMDPPAPDAVNLGLAGSLTPDGSRVGGGLALTERWLAALVDEAGQGTSPMGLNAGDADIDDLVLHLQSVDGSMSEADWENTEQAAVAVDLLDVGGTTFGAILTREADQAGLESGDGDASDKVIQLVRPDLPVPAHQKVVPVRAGGIEPGDGGIQPAEEFVLGRELLVFRTREASLCPDDDCTGIIGSCDHNADGDCDDAFLQVLDLGFDPPVLRSPSRSVRVCQLEACEQTTPYRVAKSTVRFLVREQDEGAAGTDLNDDGDADDLLVALFKARAPVESALEIIGDVIEKPEVPSQPGVDLGQAGLTGDPFADPLDDEEEGGSQIVIAAGVCVAGEAREGACDEDADCPADFACDPEKFAAIGVGDRDGDGIVDGLDNCPDVANPSQIDQDGDRVGDYLDAAEIGDPDADLACDLAVCGNGVREIDEVCDDANLDDIDGCNAFCRLAPCKGDLNDDLAVDASDQDAFDACFACGEAGCSQACLDLADFNGDGFVNNLDSLRFELRKGALCYSEPAPPAVSSAPPGRRCGLLGVEALLALLPLAALRRRR